MPKKALQTSILKEKRKIIIMDTALRLFATYGIDNITIDDITKALKISHGLFYHYYKDKDSLLKDIFNKSKTIFSILLAQIDLQNDTPTEILHKFSTFIFESLSDNDEKAYYIYLLLTCNFQEISRKSERGALAIQSLLNVIKKGQETGEFKTNVSATDILTIYLTSIEGLTYGKIKYREDYVLPDVQAIMNIVVK